MKKAYIIVRVLMGLLFLFSSISFLFKLIEQPEQTGNMKIFVDGMNASGYMMQAVKLIELVCGIAFVSGFFVPLASILISPIIINILFVHIFLDTSGLPIALYLVASNLFIAHIHREIFLPILKPKS